MSPLLMPPSEISFTPSPKTASMAILRIRFVRGFIRPEILPVIRAVFCHSSEASEYFRRSWELRAKERTTLTPERFSLSRTARRSNLFCISLKRGMQLFIIRASTMMNIGITARIIRESLRLIIIAITSPPMHRKGARITRRMSMATAY